MSKRVDSLVQELKPKDLPEVVFYVEDASDKKIRRLTNLRVEDKSLSGGHCGCYKIIGDEVVKDGKTRHVNVVSASATDCYSSLSLALEAIALANRKEKKREFVSRFNGGGYRSNKLQQVDRLKSYPDIVFSVLVENECSPVEKIDDLKTAHYQEVLDNRELYPLIVRRIVDSEFPDLADDQEDDEED